MLLKCICCYENRDFKKENTETLTEICKEIDQEVNTETKYMLLHRHQNAGQTHGTKTANISFENVAQFKYL
jgi:hypothetical protein